jgi:hypothetical protein
LLPALTGLEWAIRHEPNRTSTLEKAEFLPSLAGQMNDVLRSYRAMISASRPRLRAKQVGYEGKNKK